ncbi:MAG TPA: hypothetical protein VMU75_14935 [Acidimicrobiales bacterium]|nr:hypothetical protein [Acidimicrobiales bacterium]
MTQTCADTGTGPAVAPLDPPARLALYRAMLRVRQDAQAQSWLARDPVPRYRERLEALGVDAATLDAIEAAARAEADEARGAAEAPPLADPASIERDVFADGGARWRS